MIFFSAHGVPVTYVENAGDPYKNQMEECIRLIMQELKSRGFGNDHTLAYQVSCSIYICKPSFWSYVFFDYSNCCCYLFASDLQFLDKCFSCRYAMLCFSNFAI